jgi:hypothetical protein
MGARKKPPASATLPDEEAAPSARAEEKEELLSLGDAESQRKNAARADYVDKLKSGSDLRQGENRARLNDEDKYDALGETFALTSKSRVELKQLSPVNSYLDQWPLSAVPTWGDLMEKVRDGFYWKGETSRYTWTVRVGGHYRGEGQFDMPHDPMQQSRYTAFLRQQHEEEEARRLAPPPAPPVPPAPQPVATWQGVGAPPVVIQQPAPVAPAAQPVAMLEGPYGKLPPGCALPWPGFPFVPMPAHLAQGLPAPAPAAASAATPAPPPGPTALEQMALDQIKSLTADGKNGGKDASTLLLTLLQNSREQETRRAELALEAEKERHRVEKEEREARYLREKEERDAALLREKEEREAAVARERERAQREAQAQRDREENDRRRAEEEKIRIEQITTQIAARFLPAPVGTAGVPAAPAPPVDPLGQISGLVGLVTGLKSLLTGIAPMMGLVPASGVVAPGVEVPEKPEDFVHTEGWDFLKKPDGTMGTGASIPEVLANSKRVQELATLAKDGLKETIDAVLTSKSKIDAANLEGKKKEAAAIAEADRQKAEHQNRLNRESNDQLERRLALERQEQALLQSKQRLLAAGTSSSPPLHVDFGTPSLPPAEMPAAPSPPPAVAPPPAHPVAQHEPVAVAPPLPAPVAETHAPPPVAVSAAPSGRSFGLAPVTGSGLKAPPRPAIGQRRTG